MLLIFDMLLNWIINNLGEKMIKICMMGNEKNCIIVVLICVGDGSKLRLMVIFKRKIFLKVVNKYGVVIVV